MSIEPSSCDLHAGAVVLEALGRARRGTTWRRPACPARRSRRPRTAAAAVWPSTTMPLGASSKAVWATTRTLPLIWMASAKAARSSCTMSSIVSMSIGAVARRDGDPDARAGDRHLAGEDGQRVGAAPGPAPRAACRDSVRDCRFCRVLSSRAISVSARWVVAASAAEHVDEVLLAVAGVGVVDLVGAHLGDRGEADHRQQDADHGLARGRACASPRAAGPRPDGARRSGRVRWLRRVRGLGRARSGPVGRRLRHGRGAAGWRRRWRRSGCPRTTMTPVDSWPPTPSLSPR